MANDSRADGTLPVKRFVDVADGVVAVINGDGSMGVANAAIVIEGESALVYDATTLPAMAREVVEEVERRGARVATVLNSHHHLDHVGGNGAFRGARVVAHPQTAAIVREMARDVGVLGRLMPRFAAAIATLELVVPEPSLEDLRPPRGGRLLVRGPAHAPVDVALWLPAERVLLAGDLCFKGVTPLAVHGSLRGWARALDDLVGLAPVAVVPGHGPLAGVEDLLTLQRYLRSVVAMAERVDREGLDEAVAVGLLELGPASSWLEPGRTLLNLRRALQEVRGEDLSLAPVRGGASGPPDTPTP
jgi:cyclase